MEPTNDEQLLLTDDEVIAIAARRESFWPTVFPSVDVEDRDALVNATFRGLRSLVARELADDAAVPVASVAKLADTACGRTDVISVYVGDDGFQRASLAMASAHYRSGNEWLLETISPAGLHGFSWCSQENTVRYLQMLLDAALLAEVPKSAEPDAPLLRLCIAFGERDGATVLAARPRQAQQVQLGRDGKASGPPSAVTGINAEVQRLALR